MGKVRGDVGKTVGVWGSVLGYGGRCREVLREVCGSVLGGVEKYWGRCGKVCWDVGKCVGVWERCGARGKVCWGVWKVLGEMWGSVLGYGKSKMWGEVCGEVLGEVCWGMEKVR